MSSRLPASKSDSPNCRTSNPIPLQKEGQTIEGQKDTLFILYACQKWPRQYWFHWFRCFALVLSSRKVSPPHFHDAPCISWFDCTFIVKLLVNYLRKRAYRLSRNGCMFTFYIAFCKSIETSSFPNLDVQHTEKKMVERKL